jgi:chemotaxis protein MotA
MSSNGFGFIFALAVIVIMAVWTDPEKPLRFLDAHGGFVVFLGTAAIALISVPSAEIKTFFPMIRVVARKYKDDSVEIVNQLVEMAELARIDMQQLATFKPKVTDPFLRDAIDLLVSGFESDAIEKILKRRIEVQKEREANQMKMFKNLGKYPPAAGLMGTVMGMIALLSTLGQEGAGEKIGPAMSVALAATLYGVIVANVMILPIADNLMFRTQRTAAKRQMIVEGIMLIKKKTPGILVREMLMSHIAPSARGKIVDSKSSGSEVKVNAA